MIGVAVAEHALGRDDRRARPGHDPGCQSATIIPSRIGISELIHDDGSRGHA